MDSSDLCGVKITVIGFAFSAMTQQARNIFNYWNAKIESQPYKKL